MMSFPPDDMPSSDSRQGLYGSSDGQQASLLPPYSHHPYFYSNQMIPPYHHQQTRTKEDRILQRLDGGGRASATSHHHPAHHPQQQQQQHVMDHPFATSTSYSQVAPRRWMVDSARSYLANTTVPTRSRDHQRYNDDKALHLNNYYASLASSRESCNSEQDDEHELSFKPDHQSPLKTNREARKKRKNRRRKRPKKPTLSLEQAFPQPPTRSSSGSTRVVDNKSIVPPTAKSSLKRQPSIEIPVDDDVSLSDLSNVSRHDIRDELSPVKQDQEGDTASTHLLSSEGTISQEDDPTLLFGVSIIENYSVDSLGFSSYSRDVCLLRAPIQDLSLPASAEQEHDDDDPCFHLTMLRRHRRRNKSDEECNACIIQ